VGTTAEARRREREHSRPLRVALLLGKPPERSATLPEVITCLRAAGAIVRAHVPGPDGWLPGWLDDVDVIALRGLRRQTLADLAEREQRGLRCCNAAHATLTARDRVAVQRVLTDAHIAVPTAAAVQDVAQARRWAADRPVVVKAGKVDGGRGLGVVMWPGGEPGPEPAGGGPYLVQEWVPGDGVDRKIYVAGAVLGGLLKPQDDRAGAGRPFSPSPSLRTLALAVGRALRLEIFGVDVVEGPDGPVVVDVNAFPSCRGVPGAARAIAGVLLARAGHPGHDRPVRDSPQRDSPQRDSTAPAGRRRS
jgi:ribosomal protein S6--L-glutamate ligase